MPAKTADQLNKDPCSEQHTVTSKYASIPCTKSGRKTLIRKSKCTTVLRSSQCCPEEKHDISHDKKHHAYKQTYTCPKPTTLKVNVTTGAVNWRSRKEQGDTKPVSNRAYKFLGGPTESQGMAQSHELVQKHLPQLLITEPITEMRSCYSTSFSAMFLYSVTNEQQYEKYLCNQSSHY